jgi:hypothetical protein
MMKTIARVVTSLLAAAMAVPPVARAQSDEIQVYDGGLAPTGVFNLTWHNNYTPDGVKTSPFPGAVVADRSWNGVLEWAYGVSRWFELGLYLPLYSWDHATGWGLDGGKLRTLFAVPNADERRFFYGVNFEFSCNARRWDTKRLTSEIRPIIGWHLQPVDLIINPIFDTSYEGLNNFEFVPSTRVAYNVSKSWAIAAEEYADYGPVRRFFPGASQAHQLYAVVDHTNRSLDVEAGVGFGLTDATDRLTFKLILSHDFNTPRAKP